MTSLVIRAPSTISSPLANQPYLPDANLLFTFDADALSGADLSSISNFKNASGTLSTSADLNAMSATPPKLRLAAVGGTSKAVEFSGAQFARTTLADAFTAVNMPVTVVGLIKVNSIGSLQGILTGRDSTSYMLLQVNTNGTLRGGAGSSNELTGPAIIAGEWAFVAAVYNGSSSRIYVESAFTSGSMGTTAPAGAILKGITVGSSSGGVGSFLNGQVAYLAGYNKALTDSEVATLRQRVRSSHGLTY